MTNKIALVVLLAGALATVGAGCRDANREAVEPTVVDTGNAIPDASNTTSTALANAATATPVVAAGVRNATIRVGGLERSYRVFVPKSAPSSGSKVPLVIAMHGGLGTPQQFAETTAFEALAEREGFIVAFPAGVERTWNGGRCCGQAMTRQVDDVGFLVALIAELEATLPVDGRRVLMTGHSNGGIMAFRFACERPDLVAAVAPVAASLETTASCTPSSPVPLLNIHGDADRNLPLEGGRGPRSIAGTDFRSTADSMSAWASAMGCAASPTTKRTGAITTSAWSGCREGVRTELIVIAGADHPWPGSTDRRASNLQGEPTQLLNATEVAWEFLVDVTR